MSNASRVRVELKGYNPNSSYDEREVGFRRMFSIFKKQVSETGILQECRQRESYESRGGKRRRKKKESEAARLKAKLKENFTQKRPHE